MNFPSHFTSAWYYFKAGFEGWKDVFHQEVKKQAAAVGRLPFTGHIIGAPLAAACPVNRNLDKQSQSFAGICPLFRDIFLSFGKQRQKEWMKES